MNIAKLDEFFAKEQENAVNLNTFMKHVRRYTKLETLDTEIVRTFIEKIIVYDLEPGKKRRGIRLKIVYNCIGEIQLAELKQKQSA